MRSHRPQLVRSSVLVAMLGVVLSLSACGKGTNHIDSAGVSFDYPGDWHRLSSAAATPSGSTASRIGVGIDQDNAAVLVVTHLSKPVTAQDFQQTEAALIQIIGQGAQRRGGTLSSPAPFTLAGIPAFSLEIDGVRGPTGRVVSSRLVVALRGKTEYFLNCEHTTDHADEVDKGCDQIVQTFNVSSAG